MLEANGRMSYEEIARLDHPSANALRGRVQALTKRGVIRGIHADIDWDGGGPRIEVPPRSTRFALGQQRVNKGTPDRPRRLEELPRNHARSPGLPMDREPSGIHF